MKKYFPLAILLWIATSWGQGFILPRPGGGSAELMEHRFTADLEDQVAEIKVMQTFHNPSPRPLEGVYYFPIPQEAIINQFALYVDGKKLAGELLDRDQARALYEDIVRRNIDPALLEYADHRFFRLSLFPLPAHQNRKIELTYSQVLPFQNGLVRFLYPLHGEMQRGRGAIPALPPRPQWARNEERGPVHDPARCRQFFSLTLTSQTALGSIYSPSHAIEVQRRSDYQAHITYEGDRHENEADFILYYSRSGDAMGMNLLCHRTGSDPGYFMLLVSPRSSWAEDRILDKDVIFVLDTSGSMAGEKMEQAKAALTYCLNSLHSRDRFALVTFSSEVRTWNLRWTDAAQSRQEAVDYVRRLEATGGTNIDEALKTAFSFKPAAGRSGSVLFITDGLPTVGVQDIKAILSHVQSKPAGQRIFTFGVGNDVNTYLLDKIAETGRAVSDYIAPEENIEEKISRFFDKVSRPVLTDLQVELAEGQVLDVYPKQLPDLFDGDQLMLVGRYARAGAAPVVLRGTSGHAQRRFTYQGQWAQKAENDFLPRLWAFRKIAYLVEDMRTHGENAEVRKEIEALSKEYGVLSPFTAFLAQEDEARALPVVLDHHPGRFMIEAHSAGAPAQGPMNAVGAAAVQLSKGLREMKEKKVVDSNEQFRYAGGKGFSLRNDEWVETRYNGEPVLAVKRDSDACLNLLKAYPELGRYLAVAERVLFSWNGRYLRIGETGESERSVESWRVFFK